MNFLRGDFRHFFPDSLIDFATIPLVWDASLNSGLGIFSANTLWITSYLHLTAHASKLGLDWFQIGTLFWIIPIIILSFISPFLLSRLFLENKKFSIIASIVYALNTYFLTIFSGGQVGVSFAYAFAPLVIYSFLKTSKTLSISKSLLLGLTLAAQILFDPRLTLLTLLICFIIFLFAFRKTFRYLLYVVLIPFLLAGLLHVYWILPAILFPSSGFPAGFGDIASVDFFSFAFFENTLSLLHPNWPENIFGKVYFMRPEFLVIPFIAYASLFFIKKVKSKEIILSFIIVGLLGSFLAKGTNEPFGFIYKSLIETIPGFSIYRDPTKFYLLIALSYSILVPFTLERICILAQQKFKKSDFTVITIFLLLWLFLMRDGSTLITSFSIKEIPAEYTRLASFIGQQQDFSRTLWIPQWQRYGYFSSNHPAIGRFELLKSASSSSQLKELEKLYKDGVLSDLSVKYIIVPHDSEGEIFLEDRKYNAEEKKQTVDYLNKTFWLKPVSGFSEVYIYELSSYNDRFLINGSGKVPTWKRKNTTEYSLELAGVKKGDILIFSEQFHPNWQMEIGNQVVNSQKYKSLLNSFIIPEDGEYPVKVVFYPQKMVYLGLGVSILALGASAFLLLTRKSHD